MGHLCYPVALVIGHLPHRVVSMIHVLYSGIVFLVVLNVLGFEWGSQ